MCAQKHLGLSSVLIFVSMWIYQPFRIQHFGFYTCRIRGEIYTNQAPDDLAQLTDMKVDGTVTGALTQVSHFFWLDYSDLTRPHLKRWLRKGNGFISGKSRLVKCYSLARSFS